MKGTIMIGAIIGDIIGSRFEGMNSVPENFELVVEHSKFTDDTVHTIAIAKAIAEHKQTGQNLEELSVKYLQEFGRRYIWCGCGDKFYEWLFKFSPEPYGSYGNGAVMRVSPCAYLSSSHKQADEYAQTVTAVTHNHPDAVCAARAVTMAICLLKQGASKEKMLKKLIHKRLYKPSSIPKGFDVTAKGTLNIAMQAFMNGDSFESVIRNAVIYAGDTDTNAAVAGSIAEAYYGVPQELKEMCFNKLDDFLKETLIEVSKITDICIL